MMSLLRKSSLMIAATALAVLCSSRVVDANDPPAPSPTDPPCWSNGTEIFEELKSDPADFAFRRVFVLCPNTVFDGDVDKFLTVKSRMTLQCGQDGKSSNNCLVKGASYSLVLGKFGGLPYLRLSEVEIKGLTFGDAQLASFFGAGVGDITFTDCIFKDNRASGTVLGGFDPLAGSDGLDLLTMTFRNVTFENIVHTIGQGGFEFEGIIRCVNEYHHLILDNVVFRNNHFPGTFSSPRGFAVKMKGGTLDVRNTCFYDNTFIGWSYIEAFENTTVTSSQNFAEWPHPVVEDPVLFGRDPEEEGAIQYSAQERQLSCTLIATSALVEPDSRSGLQCINATESMCLSTGYVPNETYRIKDPNEKALTSDAASAWTIHGGRWLVGFLLLSTLGFVFPESIWMQW